MPKVNRKRIPKWKVDLALRMAQAGFPQLSLHPRKGWRWLKRRGLSPARGIEQ